MIYMEINDEIIRKSARQAREASDRLALLDRRNSIGLPGAAELGASGRGEVNHAGAMVGALAGGTSTSCGGGGGVGKGSSFHFHFNSFCS